LGPDQCLGATLDASLIACRDGSRFGRLVAPGEPLMVRLSVRSSRSSRTAACIATPTTHTSRGRVAAAWPVSAGTTSSRAGSSRRAPSSAGSASAGSAARRPARAGKSGLLLAPGRRRVGRAVGADRHSSNSGRRDVVTLAVERGLSDLEHIRHRSGRARSRVSRRADQRVPVQPVGRAIRSRAAGDARRRRLGHSWSLSTRLHHSPRSRRRCSDTCTFDECANDQTGHLSATRRRCSGKDRGRSGRSRSNGSPRRRLR